MNFWFQEQTRRRNEERRLQLLPPEERKLVANQSLFKVSSLSVGQREQLLGFYKEKIDRLVTEHFQKNTLSYTAMCTGVRKMCERVLVLLETICIPTAKEKKDEVDTVMSYRLMGDYCRYMLKYLGPSLTDDEIEKYRKQGMDAYQSAMKTEIKPKTSHQAQPSRLILGINYAMFLAEAQRDYDAARKVLQEVDRTHKKSFPDREGEEPKIDIVTYFAAQAVSRNLKVFRSYAVVIDVVVCSVSVDDILPEPPEVEEEHEATEEEGTSVADTFYDHCFRNFAPIVCAGGNDDDVDPDAVLHAASAHFKQFKAALQKKTGGNATDAQHKHLARFADVMQDLHDNAGPQEAAKHKEAAHEHLKSEDPKSKALAHSVLSAAQKGVVRLHLSPLHQLTGWASSARTGMAVAQWLIGFQPDGVSWLHAVDHVSARDSDNTNALDKPSDIGGLAGKDKAIPPLDPTGKEQVFRCMARVDISIRSLPTDRKKPPFGWLARDLVNAGRPSERDPGKIPPVSISKAKVVACGPYAEVHQYFKGFDSRQLELNKKGPKFQCITKSVMSRLAAYNKTQEAHGKKTPVHIPLLSSRRNPWNAWNAGVQ